MTYLARVTGGALTVSDDPPEVGFIHPTDFDHIPIHDTVRLRLHHHASAATPPTSDNAGHRCLGRRRARTSPQVAATVAVNTDRFRCGELVPHAKGQVTP